jgi:hypothetical protein
MSTRVPSRHHHSALQRIRTLSFLLDNAIKIPGTRYRIGLDPIVGLLVGGGDVAGVILSAYIVLEAARLGLPRRVLLQMLNNLILDAVGGSIPLLGDLFDASWKANARNLKLIEAEIAANSDRAQPADRLFLSLMMVVLLGIVAITVGLAVLLFNLRGNLFFNWSGGS